MFDITTVGEILIDLTQTGVSENGIPVYTSFPGGAPANVAVAASKLGAKTAFIGKVGNDAFGRLLVDTVKQNGVNADCMIVSDTANTTLAVVSVDSSGERNFAFYRRGFADTLLSEDEIPDDILKASHFLHFGSVSLTDEPSRIGDLIFGAKGEAFGATITYDPNYRESLWHDRDEAIEMMKRPLPMVDILKISDEELPLLTGTDDAEKGTKMLARHLRHSADPADARRKGRVLSLRRSSPACARASRSRSPIPTARATPSSARSSAAWRGSEHISPPS